MNADLPPRPDTGPHGPWEEHFAWLQAVAPSFVGLTRAEANALAVDLHVLLCFNAKIRDGRRSEGTLVPEKNVIWLNIGRDGRVEQAAGDSWPLELGHLPVE